MKNTPTQTSDSSVEGTSASPDQWTDEQLLLAYRASGNREWFAQLVYRYERKLFRYLQRYLHDCEMAEDVFQTTFLHVHLKCHQFEAGRRFSPWLFAIATNQAIDAIRRVQRHKMVSLNTSNDESHHSTELVDLLESDGVSPAEFAEQSERSETVRRRLNELPKQLYDVVDLVFFQGMKYREAAQTLQIPEGTVKSRMNAAVSKLSRSWEYSQVA